MIAETIDEVIEFLTEIIEWAKENNSRLGYFPALYRKVTIEVKERIAVGYFDDGGLMERLDVVFANRYLEAFEQLQSELTPAQAWQLAFDATGFHRPIVLQHLLLGMNAHIDLDLGIAVADTVRLEELLRIKRDYLKINQILFSLIDQVQQELASIWPMMRFVDFAAGQFDEALTRFGVRLARDHAWEAAGEILRKTPEEREERISQLDRQAVQIGRAILRPGIITSLALLLIRSRERETIPRIIEILE